MEPHGQVRLKVQVCQGAYSQVGKQAPSTNRVAVISAISDTGAQLCLGGRDVMAKLQLKESDLLRSSISVSVANNAGLRILGVVFVTISRPQNSIQLERETAGSFRDCKGRDCTSRGEGGEEFQVERLACPRHRLEQAGGRICVMAKEVQVHGGELGCCRDGWATVAVGSRFCTHAESRYAPIEGELLGLAWALKKTSHYTLGCPKLLCLVDHKPLIGLLTKGEIGDIDNLRLQSLAEKTMR